MGLDTKNARNGAPGTRPTEENLYLRGHRGAPGESNLCLVLPWSNLSLRCAEAGFEIVYFGVQAFGEVGAEAGEVVFDQRDFG